MKKKIGEIYNKPIVTGDKNLVTKNEIHESQLSGGEGSNNNTSKLGYYYYDITKPYPNDDPHAETFKGLVMYGAFIVTNTKDLLGYNLILNRNTIQESGVPAKFKEPIKFCLDKNTIHFSYRNGEVTYITGGIFDILYLEIGEQIYDIKEAGEKYFKITEEEFLQDTKLA
jgi:hypothetical protein